MNVERFALMCFSAVDTICQFVDAWCRISAVLMENMVHERLYPTVNVSFVALGAAEKAAVVLFVHSLIDFTWGFIVRIPIILGLLMRFDEEAKSVAYATLCNSNMWVGKGAFLIVTTIENPFEFAFAARQYVHYNTIMAC